MQGLKIRTVQGREFEVWGNVTYHPATDIYYCAGESWPASIVVEIHGNPQTI